MYVGYVIWVVLILLLLALAGSCMFLISRAVGLIARKVTKNHPLSERITAQAIRYSYIGSAILIAFEAYTAIYPTDNFFLNEFKHVTLREPPKSAIVIAKSASYPDIHGSYCSYSRIELSLLDYSSLLSLIEADTRFKRGDSTGNDEMENALEAMPALSYTTSFIRSIDGHEAYLMEIKFASTGKHIEVSLCA